MSLTNNDLNSIRKIVRDEVHDQICAEVPKIVHDQITMDVSPIVEGKIYPLKSDIRIIREKLEQIWKSESEDIIATTGIIDKLKKEIDELKLRVKKLELS